MNTDQPLLFPAARSRTPTPPVPQSSYGQPHFNHVQQTAFRVPSLNTILAPPVQSGNFPRVQQASAQPFPAATRVPPAHHFPPSTNNPSLPTTHQFTTVPPQIQYRDSTEKPLFSARKTRD